MRVKPLLLASLMVAAAMIVFAFWAAGQLPPDAQLPTHWNLAGEADRWMPALRALLVPPALLAGVAALFALIPRLEPLQDRLDKSAPLLAACWIGLIGLLIFLQGFIAAPAFGMRLGSELVYVAVGLLFLMLGNVLPKSRPGFFVGIRTPWTIIDADNWIATHRLGGKCFMAGGALLVIAGLLDIAPEARMVLIASAIGISALVPIAYSWWFWQNHRETSD